MPKILLISDFASGLPVITVRPHVFFACYLKTIYPNSTTDYYRERAEAEIIRSELGFIENHGVGMVDIQLMLDLISVEILR